MAATKLTPMQKEAQFALALFAIAVVASIAIELVVAYQSFPLLALTEPSFYESLGGTILVLGIVPYVVAFISGKLLWLISVILREKKEYPSQFLAGWLVLFVFAYYSVQMATLKSQSMDALITECVKVYQAPSKSESQVSNLCTNRVLPVYPGVKYCMGAPKGKQRKACLSKVLKAGKLGLLVESTSTNVELNN